MKAAVNKTYISKRMINRYTEERIRQQEEQQAQNSNPAPVLPPKTFSEDTAQTSIAQPVLAPIEEEKKELEQTSANLAAAAQEQQQPEAQKKPGFFASLTSIFTSSKKPEAAAATENPAAMTKAKKRKNSIDRNLSCDEMDSDDLDGDLNLSDEEGGDKKRAVFKAQLQSVAPPREDREQYNVEFDTNIFKVSLDCLESRGKIVAGDAEFCTKCNGVFNQTSKLTDEEGKQIWTCEFCNTRNEVVIGEEEIPTSTEVTYLLEAAAQVEAAEEEKKAEQDTKKASDTISVVFCIDISGSMQSQNRLGLCKQAIMAQINSMAESNGKRKLGLVAFDHTVEVIGDGIEKPMTISDNATLTNYDSLLQIGLTQAGERMNKPVSETKDNLLARVDALQVKGRTALGPAVLASVAMASKGAPGSQVIICTDGMANVGIGSFNQYGRGSGAEDDATKFYDKVGSLAEESGVMVNLVTIAGCDANVQGLSRLIELSGGQIEQVNPNELSNDFANILSQKAIATKVEAKVKLHKGLQFRNELEKDLAQDNTILTRRFGNVTADSMFTFEYGMKPISALLKMEDLDMAQITHFPFQTQIVYTTLDGAKCLRVITQKLEVSSERDELTKNADAELVQQNVLMQGSKQARAGNTRKAQAIMKVYNKRTKGLESDAWQANRADFSAQASEAYTAMNCQAASMKMPQVQQLSMPMQQDQQSSMNRGGPKRKMQKRAAPPMQMQQQMQMNAMPAMQQEQQMLSMSMQQPMQQQQVRQDDRFSSQMYQMSTKAKRSKY